MAEALLAVDQLEAWYGESHILHGMSFSVAKGELVTLLGRNGAGKTTSLRAIMGLVGRRSGSVRFEGQEMIALPSDRIGRAGIAYCPEERGIFSSLSVAENLVLPPIVREGGLSMEELRGLFPRLWERAASQGTKLSGGEQQMLAIARALMSNPTLLLLDEPSMGLAPRMVEEIFAIIGELKRAGATILLVEQNARAALAIADHAYVLETGRVALEGRSARIARDEGVAAAYLGAAR